MEDEKVPMGEPRPYSQVQSSSQMQLAYSPPAPTAPGSYPSGPDGALNPPKGYPIPTSENEPSYEDTASFSKDFLTIWYHMERNRQYKWILNLSAVSHVVGKYKKHWRDPFVKYIHYGIYQEVLYFFLPMQCNFFFLLVLISILSVLGAGLQSASLQVAAWVFALIAVFVGALTSYNFIRFQPLALKDHVAAVVLYILAYICLLGSFFALTHAFHAQYYRPPSVCGSANFFQSAMCLTNDCPPGATPPPFALGPCDGGFNLHLSTPSSWLLAWLGTLVFLPVGCLLIGKLRLMRKPVTLCHLTFHGHRSFGFPRTVKVSISTADQIMQEYQRCRAALPFNSLDPIMPNNEPIIDFRRGGGMGMGGGLMDGFGSLFSMFSMG